MIIPILIALQAQSVPKVELTKPTQVVDAEFSQIRGVRELADGRLIVSDRLEQKVAVVTPKTGASETIGRVGSGPAEYRLPTGVFAIPGDSTLLIDEGNSRIGVIAPDLKLKRVFSLQLPNVGFQLSARGRDGSGRYILTIPNWIHARGPGGDSVVMVRFDEKANRVDTLTVLKGPTQPPHPGYSPEPRIPMVIFSPQDVYAVAPDGWVAIARTGDFHFEWLAPDGTWTRGPKYSYEPITVTEAEKTAYVKRFNDRSNIGGKAGGLQASSSEFNRPDQIARVVKATTWAEKKSAFTESAPVLAGDGSAWVERSAVLGAAPLYDVFDRKGVRVRSVQLPQGRRLIAVGKQTAYLINVDNDGLEHLELYQLPR